MNGTPRETVYQLLDSGKSVREVSKETGVPIATIGRWMKERREGKVVAMPKLVIAPPVVDTPSRATPSPGGPPRKSSSIYQPVDVANLSDDVREGLRETVRNTVHWLRTGPEGRSKAWAEGAGGLARLMTSVPELMKIETITATAAEATASAPPTATDVAGEIAKRRRQQSTG